MYYQKQLEEIQPFLMALADSWDDDKVTFVEDARSQASNDVDDEWALDLDADGEDIYTFGSDQRVLDMKWKEYKQFLQKQGNLQRQGNGQLLSAPAATFGGAKKTQIPKDDSGQKITSSPSLAGR